MKIAELFLLMVYSFIARPWYESTLVVTPNVLFQLIYGDVYR